MLILLLSSFSTRALKALVQNSGSCWELDMFPEKNTNGSNDLLTAEGPGQNKLSKYQSLFYCTLIMVF